MKVCILIPLGILLLALNVDAKPDRPDPEEKKKGNDLITMEVQKAVDAGLAYLRKQQADDGSFGTGNHRGHVGVTGLAGLALLSAERNEANDKAIARAVQYLIGSEDATPGYIYNRQAATPGPMYGHAFSVQFLADAMGRFADDKQQKEAKALLERAVKLLVAVQNQDGGWRYTPQSADADISITSCQVVALHSAQRAGIQVPKATLDNAVKYIKGCQDANSGGFRYQQFGGGPGLARTAAAVASLTAVEAQRSETTKSGLAFLKNLNGNAPLDRDVHLFFDRYYSARAWWNAGDADFRKWFPAVRDELVKEQQKDHWEHGPFCPHYSTAIALIVLQTPEGRLESLKRK